jgi:hypothetical protein
VLGAHFLRVGLLAPVVLLILLVPLLALRQRWVPRLFQLVLVLGGIEWVRTLLALRALRIDRGEPTARMVAILAGVAAFTLLSAALFETPRLRRRFRPTSRRRN